MSNEWVMNKKHWKPWLYLRNYNCLRRSSNPCLTMTLANDLRIRAWPTLRSQANFCSKSTWFNSFYHLYKHANVHHEDWIFLLWSFLYKLNGLCSPQSQLLLAEKLKNDQLYNYQGCIQDRSRYMYIALH